MHPTHGLPILLRDILYRKMPIYCLEQMHETKQPIGQGQNVHSPYIRIGNPYALLNYNQATFDSLHTFNDFALASSNRYAT